MGRAISALFIEYFCKKNNLTEPSCFYGYYVVHNPTLNRRHTVGFTMLEHQLRGYNPTEKDFDLFITNHTEWQRLTSTEMP